MVPTSNDSLETLPLSELRLLVAGPERVGNCARTSKRCAQNQRLGEDSDGLRSANEALRSDNEKLRDEIHRLKNLAPRPPLRPSGMEKATQHMDGAPAATGKRKRGAKKDREPVTPDIIVKADVPPGSRLKAYQTSLARELVLSSEVLRYRREHWIGPDGKSSVALFPVGIHGGFGQTLRQFCLVLHTQGQVTTETIAFHSVALGRGPQEGKGGARGSTLPSYPDGGDEG